MVNANKRVELEAKTNFYSKLFLVLLSLLILFLVFFVGFYFFYQNVPGDPIDLNPILTDAPTQQNQTYEEAKQFYPGMKFNHNKISYSIDGLCDDETRERMIEAFDLLSSEVGIIEFYEVSYSSDLDIEVSCSNGKRPVDKEYFIAGEGGAREIIQTERYNIINGGTVILHESPTRFLKCDWANVELHELLHVFGFDHSEDPKSLMYAFLEDCEQEIDDSIINELRSLYSEKNLADLYFEDIKVVKKRKYIDFNLTVKNSGSIDAENVKISIFDDEELVQSFDLKDEDGKIKYGAGIIVGIENLKLENLNPQEIKFVIDHEGFVEEIDENNNIARVEFVRD